MTLMGKGYFIWQIPNCDRGDPGAITERSINSGLSHVLIKIADGSHWAYNYDYKKEIDLVPPVLKLLKRKGVQVWGWHYVRGDDPLAEARLGVRRAKELGIDGYVIDAEKEYGQRGKAKAARRYVEELRSGLPDMPMALSSYRYPDYHPDLPYEVFLEKVDYCMPQIYFEQAHNPERQLERSLEQYSDLRPARPVIPTAPTYSTDNWRPTADEVKRLLKRAKELGLSGANAWSWDFAARPGYMDLWNAVAEFDWPAGPPPMDIADKLIKRLNTHEANKVVALYQENAAHVTGARTVVGKGPIEQWYRMLLGELLPEAKFELAGKSGDGSTRHITWTADSRLGKVRNGSDTLGLRNGLIQYHYTYFTIT